MNIKISQKVITILTLGTVTLVGCSLYQKNKEIKEYLSKNDVSNTIEVSNDEENSITTSENIVIEEENILEQVTTPIPTSQPTPTPTSEPTPTQTPTLTPTPSPEKENVEEDVTIEPTQDESIKTEEPTIMNLDGVEIETKKVVEATTTVNIRNGASANSNKLGSITKGSKLDVINKENDDWYRVKYNNQEAFISSHYVKEKMDTNINAPVEKFIYMKKESTLYDAYNSNPIMSIPYLEAAPVFQEADGYYLTSIDNNIGFIPKSDTGVLDGTFAIVDISDQTAYLYEGTQLILSTPVVTGKPSSPTTKGLHEVWHISEDRYLKGDNYEVYVDYFDAFCGGIGFHDSEYHTHYDSKGKKVFSHGWRSQFGGNIYKTSGSHGCVNMPHDAAEVFYNNLEIGDKVLVKQ